MEASSCCSRSPDGAAQVGVGNCSGLGPSRRNVHRRRRSLDDATPGLTKPCHPPADFLLAQMGGLCWFVLSSYVGHVVEVFGVGCDAA